MAEQRVFFLLNQAQRKLLKYVDSNSEKRVGISSVQAAALFSIDANHGSLLKEMGLVLKLNNSAITGLTNRMEDNGLITRKPCTLDGRATRVFLTEEGKSTLTKVKPMLKELNKKLTKDYSDDELEVILRFLNDILNIS